MSSGPGNTIHYPILTKASDICKSFTKEFVLDGEIDPGIKSFITVLNQNPNITTKYSCEGHEPDNEGPNLPYLFFNVNEIGYETFWLRCAPEITMALTSQHGDQFVLIELSAYRNPGIVIRCMHHNIKWSFWHVVTSVMLENFPAPITNHFIKDPETEPIDRDPDDLLNRHTILMPNGRSFEIGVARVIFGYRVRGGYADDDVYQFDWCCGTNDVIITLTQRALMHLIETVPLKRIPGFSNIKPWPLDSEFITVVDKLFGQPILKPISKMFHVNK